MTTPPHITSCRMAPHCDNYGKHDECNTITPVCNDYKGQMKIVEESRAKFNQSNVSFLTNALSTIQSWDHWDHVIPYIKFPQEWSIKVRPNFHGSIIRYDIREDSSGNEISVFLDCFDIFGVVGKPYWEIYPDKDGNATRINMYDVNRLLNEIQDSFDNWRKEINS